jgi:2-oxoisovalerate dehydrogenase E1 component
MTEGEVSEALQMAALKQLPLLVLVQDNGWDISAKADEVRAGNAAQFAQGFKGIEVVQVDGTDYAACHSALKDVLRTMRKKRGPVLVHAKVPLLNHHTSGVRMEWYRDDLDEARAQDPFPKLRAALLADGRKPAELDALVDAARVRVQADYDRALLAPDPSPSDLLTHRLAPTPVTQERGLREPAGRVPTVMVDCALFAVREILEAHPEALLYGQDVGRRLGGVFREAATLAQQFGDDRVFNTPIQEAFIVGSTVGMAAVGLKPIVEVQFADYIWPGLNQLFTELSRAHYLSNGKWTADMVLRVPIGAYGSGGPYHSSSVESVLTAIRGIKVLYPSNGADLKGLLKAAFADPNPVVVLEHKGLYWSKIKGTEGAKTVEPDSDYVVPIGMGRIVREQEPSSEPSVLVVTYGRGVYWALEACVGMPVEVLDLRSLSPWDETLVFERARLHGRILVLTEEPSVQPFARSIAARIQEECFQALDAPVRVLGSEDTPAIPLNKVLEATYLPNAEKVRVALEGLLSY